MGIGGAKCNSMGLIDTILKGVFIPFLKVLLMSALKAMVKKIFNISIL